MKATTLRHERVLPWASHFRTQADGRRKLWFAASYVARTNIIGLQISAPLSLIRAHRPPCCFVRGVKHRHFAWIRFCRQPTMKDEAVLFHGSRCYPLLTVHQLDVLRVTCSPVLYISRACDFLLSVNFELFSGTEQFFDEQVSWKYDYYLQYTWKLNLRSLSPNSSC